MAAWRANAHYTFHTPFRAHYSAHTPSRARTVCPHTPAPQPPVTGAWRRQHTRVFRLPFCSSLCVLLFLSVCSAAFFVPLCVFLDASHQAPCRLPRRPSPTGLPCRRTGQARGTVGRRQDRPGDSGDPEEGQLELSRSESSPGPLDWAGTVGPGSGTIRPSPLAGPAEHTHPRTHTHARARAPFSWNSRACSPLPSSCSWPG